jgi:hypothetical protein
MKKLSFVLAMLAVVLVFGLTFVSCDDGSGTTSGGGGGGGGVTASTLTITDIPSSYNGKYIGFQGTIGNTEILFGCNNITVTDLENLTVTLVQISNGRANLPMWRASQITAQGYTFTRYYGNGTAVGDESGFFILNSSVATSNTGGEALASIMFSSGITFSNGGATVSTNDGTLMGW